MAEIQFNSCRLLVPSAWKAEVDKECVTLIAQINPRGALQISTATKESGRVTDEDLVDFASARSEQQGRLQRIKTPNLTGITAEHWQNQVFWKEWWLAADNLVVYITYNVERPFKGLEDEAVQQVVESVRLMK